jgi:hypothetical protein
MGGRLSARLFANEYIHNENILLQRVQHMNKHKEHKKIYKKNSIYPWNYYWNPDNNNLMKFLSECTEITLGRQYGLSERIEIIIQTTIYKIYLQPHGQPRRHYRMLSKPARNTKRQNNSILFPLANNEEHPPHKI